jgi:hypothetical protein
MNEPSPPPQEEPPLLDVHPIHAPVCAWRDFFIHIVIIVVGLCIAVGIQQTVEFFRNHDQRDEMRRALRLEREDNYKTLTANTTAWRWGTAELEGRGASERAGYPPGSRGNRSKQLLIFHSEESERCSI